MFFFYLTSKLINNILRIFFNRLKILISRNNLIFFIYFNHFKKFYELLIKYERKLIFLNFLVLISFSLRNCNNFEL